MSFTWASHIAASMLMGCLTLADQSYNRTPTKGNVYKHLEYFSQITDVLLMGKCVNGVEYNCECTINIQHRSIFAKMTYSPLELDHKTLGGMENVINKRLLSW